MLIVKDGEKNLHKTMSHQLMEKIEKESVNIVKPVENIVVSNEEPIILAQFLLPYKLERDKKTGVLKIIESFKYPTLINYVLN